MNDSTYLAERLVHLFKTVDKFMTAMAAPLSVLMPEPEQVADFRTELHRIAVSTYVEVFTVDELQRLIDFYESPAGFTYIRKAPQVEARVGQALQAYLIKLEDTGDMSPGN